MGNQGATIHPSFNPNNNKQDFLLSRKSKLASVNVVKPKVQNLFRINYSLNGIAHSKSLDIVSKFQQIWIIPSSGLCSTSKPSTSSIPSY